MITKEQVLHIAKLSRLKLTDDEVEHFTSQLDSILVHVEELDAAPTDGIEPEDTVALIHEAVRDDVAVTSLEHDAILLNGPQVKDDHFAVPRVI